MASHALKFPVLDSALRVRRRPKRGQISIMTQQITKSRCRDSTLYPRDLVGRGKLPCRTSMTNSASSGTSGRPSAINDDAWIPKASWATWSLCACRLTTSNRLLYGSGCRSSPSSDHPATSARLIGASSKSDLCTARRLSFAGRAISRLLSRSMSPRTAASCWLKPTASRVLNPSLRASRV